MIKNVKSNIVSAFYQKSFCQKKLIYNSEIRLSCRGENMCLHINLRPIFFIFINVNHSNLFLLNTELVCCILASWRQYMQFRHLNFKIVVMI